MSDIFTDPNGLLSLQIRDDGAWMTMLNGDEMIGEGAILDLIEQAGIVEGFERARDYMEAYGLIRNFGEPFPIALHQMPSQPQIEFSLLFEQANCIDPDNFRFENLKGLETAEPGKPLAHLFVTRSGNLGRDIFGETIEPTADDREALQAKIGENVRYDADLSQLVAESVGYPYLDGEGRVCVKSEFTVDGDIDLNHENFNLHASLTVNGNIQDKISIELTGNLEVNGDIVDSTVRAGGDVKVYGDIMNCQEVGIIARGNIEFENAENAFLMAKGRIRFTEHANFCKLIGEKEIQGDPERSSIVGGMVQCGSDVEVAVLGSTGAIGTEVEITISPFVKEEMLELTKELSDLRQNEHLNDERIGRIETKLEDLENQLEEEINRTLLSDETKPKHIVAYKKVFPGTYVRILKKSRTITEEYDKISFSLIDGDLVMESYLIE